MTDDEDDVLKMAMTDASVGAAEEDEEDEGGAVDVGDVRSVAELVMAQILLEERIEKGEKLLEQLRKELEDLRTRKLPDAMLEMNVTSWTTKRDDRKLTVNLTEVYYPSVKKEDMPKLVKWLKDRGDEAIVKPKFVVDFEKGQVDEAEELFEQLIDEYPDAPIRYEPEIHWATFRSYTKDVVKEIGADQMPDFYKFHQANMAKITSRKI